MSDYKRFVSYIYTYEQGEKRENTGFVKINARGGECKIWVHMQGFYSKGQKPYKVYIYAPDRDRLLGQLLGELESRNGALEWSGATRTDSLMESGFGLDDSRGIYIEGENRILAAEWDDFPVDVGRFVPIERFARQGETDAAVPTAEVEEGPEEAPALEQAHILEKETAAEKRTEETDTGEAKARESRMERAYKTEEAAGDRQIPQESDIQAAEAAPEERPSVHDSRWSQWEYLANHFPVMRYVDGGDIISSIRLGSRDLSRIPRDKWELGNNSFLLHGFYQYRHILLLRRQTEAEVCYQVGVPGVYNEREQMMASMFGFQEFKVMKGPDVKTGSFGYWCRTLE